MSENTRAPRQTEILVARHNGTAEVRVVGRGTYACSPALREFTAQQIRDGVRAFSFDLSACPALDSTFMGLLASLVVRNRSLRMTVEIVRAGKRTKSQLSALGLKDLFAFSERGCEGQTWSAIGPPSLDEAEQKRDLRKTMLEAHEALGEADPVNVPKFSGVTKSLGKEPTDET